MTPRLLCNGVCAGYSPASPVLQGCSFSLEAKEFVAVIGPNGAGKTTLIRVLSGVLSPFAGHIHLEGKALETLSPRERARLTAVVSQRVVPLEDLTAREVTLMGRYSRLAWHSAYSRRDKEVAEAALREAGAVHLADRRCGTLSGGEWQRVLVARALAQETAILLLDEPSAGLDPGRMLDLFTLLEARRKQGAAILAVLHDINLASLYATRIIGVRDGMMLFDGPPASVFTSDHLEQLYDVRFSLFPHPVTGVPQACLVPGSGFAGTRVSR